MKPWIVYPHEIFPEKHWPQAPSPGIWAKIWATSKKRSENNNVSKSWFSPKNYKNLINCRKCKNSSPWHILQLLKTTFGSLLYFGHNELKKNSSPNNMVGVNRSSFSPIYNFNNLQFTRPLYSNSRYHILFSD
jgi:hypothetical protein